MKPSEVLKFALQLIESGKETFCCLAIKEADEQISCIPYYYGYPTSPAGKYFMKQKPDCATSDEWWDVHDKDSRVEALQRAIEDAEANGE